MVSGTCIGSTRIDTDLVIEGVDNPTSGTARLSGGGKTRVATITKGARVTMQSIEIVRGRGRWGGGILNGRHGWSDDLAGGYRGSLTLHDVVVRGNTGGGGGGVYNEGTLTLTGSTRINDNRSSIGGGVVNEGTLIMGDASMISLNNKDVGNTAIGSGGGVFNAGTLTMNGSSAISGNKVGAGGGVANDGSLTMNDVSSISGNRPTVAAECPLKVPLR